MKNYDDDFDHDDSVQHFARTMIVYIILNI